ncbi:MAG TPA: ATP-binding protein [Bacteroidota bacterium]|nr:ATP-binding protein [Bacteroidota bacterium]
MQVPFLNSLRFKVGSGYIVLVLINLAVTAWAIYNFARLTLALDTILTENFPNIVAVETMAHTVERQDHALTSIMNGDSANGTKEFEGAKEAFYQVFDEASKAPGVSQGNAENRELTEEGMILADIHSTYEGYLMVSDSLMLFADNGQYKKAKEYYGNIVRPFSQRLSENCFWLVEENQKAMLQVSQETKRTSDEAIIAVLIAALVATALSIVTIIQFTKHIIEPAEKLTETVHQIGRGRLDLKIDINTNDEVAELSREFNKMTERLRQYEELNIEKILSEKQKSETIVQSISDAIIVCDPSLIIQLINKSAEELFHIREQDVVGKRVDDCAIDNRILEIFSSPVLAPSLSEPYLQFKFNGRPIYLRPRVTEIPALHGGRGGIVLVLQDVTQYKELDKMKSDFMAAVSHEFRTPLTSINMSVDILRQGLLGPVTHEQDELLQSSKQDCERLTKLVRELLQLAKLESDKIEWREDRLDVRTVIEATVRPLQLPFKEKGVDLVLRVEDRLPSLIGDEQQLSWVISNLVNNALRYTDAGGRVEIRARCEDQAILLEVSDTGRGIAPEYLDKIFDKFVQVKQSLDTTPGSVGLGLTIAKKIVEMYGGKIWVNSVLNKGSTFSLRLPLPQHELA